MLEQIGNTGLYFMPDLVFGFRPADVLPADLDVRPVFAEKASNELVRRLLEFSNERKEWVGVGWTALMKQLDEQTVSHQQLAQRFQPKERAFELARIKYTERNMWTLGLYGRFQPPPLKPVNLELEQLARKASWSPKECRQQLGWAAVKLKQQEYLKVDVDWVGSDGRINVYFLTPSLVFKYVEYQKA